MNLDTVITFFDRRAATWDAQRQPDGQIVEQILDAADIRQGDSVLDVACGTGVLLPYYLQRDVSFVTGVDISQSMIAEACRKFSDPRIRLVCADVQTGTFDPHDKCVVFNALPHFVDPGALVCTLSGFLRSGGRLTVAHSESRERINSRHVARALDVSHMLMPADELAELFRPYFHADHVVDDNGCYLVSGVRI